jgi:alkylated DNA nucleotide flippase Atl1
MKGEGVAERSVAFADMRRALLDYVRDIPPRAVVEIGTLAQSLNIPSRHAAYMLLMLSDDERASVPWHRELPKSGAFPPAQRERPHTAQQFAMLKAEGAVFNGPWYLDLKATALWHPPQTHAATFWADFED